MSVNKNLTIDNGVLLCSKVVSVDSLLISNKPTIVLMLKLEVTEAGVEPQKAGVSERQ